MEEQLNLFYWDHAYDGILLFNLAIVIAIFACIRLFSGSISHVSASEEDFRKDNPAFGISMAGLVFAVTLMLSGTIYGDPARTIEGALISIGLYGILGIFLMIITRVIFDRISLPQISIRDEIVKGNIAAGVIDAGNMIATALIIRAVMTWITTNTLEDISALLIGYVISQIILTGVTFIRIRVFALQNNGSSIQEHFHQENIALAVRFAGRRIGTAFAITAASNIMVYEIYDIQPLLFAWAAISIVMIIILSLLSFVADRIILYKVAVNKEIISNKNLALGTVQAIIYISLGLLLAEFVV